MSSLSLSSAFISADNPKTVNPSLLSNPSKLYGLRKPQSKKLSCKASKDVDFEHDDATQTNLETNSSKFDRRSLLLGGLGSGLYGAASALGAAPNALAFPPNPSTSVLEFGPDVTTCFLKDYKGRGPSGVPCCTTQLLTNPNALKTFVPGSFNSVRVRSAAHSISPENLAKFREALYRMRNLPDTDPRSFTQQANVHCAYCDGAYRQVGDPDLDFKIHFSWVFLPFHRAYLYFFERILGKLIGDDTLAIPFWNWDHPDGMEMPKAYADNILGTDADYQFDVVNSLYDPLRDQTHLPPVPIDFKYPGDPPHAGRTRDEIIQYNLALMKQTMVDTTSSESFMGGKYVKGEGVPSSDGKLERETHTHVHVWTGDKRQSAGENMGAFYSAGRDPIFYAHHANVDRLWSVWKSLGGTRKDFTDAQWLNTYFVFYDENAEPVKIYVRDCLDSERQLGYKYEDVESPWLPSDFQVTNTTPSPATPPPPGPKPGPQRRPGFRPGPPRPGPRPGPPPPGFRPGPRPGPGGPGRFRPMSMELDPNAAGAMLAVTAVGNMSVPNIAAAATLESVTVDQLPKTLGEEGFRLTGVQRTPGQTGVAEEVLLIDLDLLRDDVYVRFDVFINDATDDDNLTSYAGCFSSLAQGPHQESGGISEPRRLRLPIDAVLKSVGAENDEYVDVIFVPKAASDAVIINAATIEAVLE